MGIEIKLGIAFGILAGGLTTSAIVTTQNDRLVNSIKQDIKKTGISATDYDRFNKNLGNVDILEGPVEAQRVLDSLKTNKQILALKFVDSLKTAVKNIKK